MRRDDRSSAKLKAHALSDGPSQGLFQHPVWISGAGNINGSRAHMKSSSLPNVSLKRARVCSICNFWPLMLTKILGLASERVFALTMFHKEPTAWVQIHQ
jgi:hypothetical protein